MGGVLVDIEDTTCYELKQEEKAMMGEFTSQTNLKIQLLNKITKIRANG
jgi:lipoate-protein ligase A